jgi:DNA-binding beta-propeller fold protein YncE
MYLSRISVGLLLCCCSFANAESDDRPGSPKAKSRSAATVLPGVQSSGAILLPNQWSLRPAGKQLELGDFPVNLALHPGGRWLAVLHAGYGEHEVIIVDLQKPKNVSRVTLPVCFYGLCFTPDGRRLFASGGEGEVVHAFDFEDGLLFHHQELAVVEPNDKFIVSGLAVDRRGENLFAAGPWGDAVCQIPLADRGRRSLFHLPRGSYPYTCLADPAGERLYVSLWSRATIHVLDLRNPRKADFEWPTEKHPTEMALTPDGKTLFVACANSTRVSVIDTLAGRTLETITCSLYPAAPAGNTPSSLSLTPDGQMLFVANADANNIAVFNVATPGQAKPLGFIPSGWYPTSVRYNPADRRLYVANGKGTTPKANPQGPNDLLPKNATIRDYIGGMFRGTLSIIEPITPAKMAAYSKQAYACSPLRSDPAVAGSATGGSPLPTRVGDPSPIKHCIYVIKENRTYDQVFGDLKEGNGDPNLCLFPERVTPNHHRLALEFVLLDNFYVDGEVSADGHQWSMGAYATDFVEKVWPLVYRGSEKKIGYPSEGNYDDVARPAGGYLWDRCAEAGVSYRSYGEWVQNGKKPGDPARAAVKALEGHIDPLFRGFDLDYPDQKRAHRFLEELARFEREGTMPQLIILRLPNDHTSGTSPGKPTPTAQVADNDLALGQVVEGVSKSKFWKDTAIFVVEDDAQNGSDHVDAHRTVALVISPYCRRGIVDSSLYSTTSMLRTMELILGLRPMSQFDAAARPMYGSFQAEPNLTAYRHTRPAVDLEEKNKATAWGARLSQEFDLTREDAADDLKLNEVIWRSVRGPNSRMPPPVRAAFVMPRGKKAKDDDD